MILNYDNPLFGQTHALFLLWTKVATNALVRFLEVEKPR